MLSDSKCVQFEGLRRREHVLFVLTIVAAAIFAHWGCLHAIFYLDDWEQIVGSDVIESGRWWTGGANAITYLTYWITWRAAGYSPQAYHVGNLGIHVLLALSIYAFGHVFTSDLWPADRRRAWFAAGLAALIFAVHPLTSEVTHYARARDHELVGFFSFLVAVCTALWIRRGWRWFPALILCSAGVAFSKGPGIWHAGLTVAIVVICISRRSDWCRLFPNRWWIYGSILTIEAGVAIFRDQVVSLFLLALSQVQNWRFGWHLLTQSRVIWCYVWRMIVPVRLCCDHLVAWTRSFSDISAWLGAAGILVWVAFTIWLWLRRYRVQALLSLMILGPLVLRFGYVVSELMVEYRTYPAMPWLALAIGVGLTAAEPRFPRLVNFSAAVIVLSFVALTTMRSHDWRSVQAVSANILRQYPLQLRAYNGLSTADLREGRYQAVLDRSSEFFQKLEQMMAVNRSNEIRYYDIWPLCAVSEECNIADAILEIKGPAAARESLKAAATRMRVTGVKNEDLWVLWHFTMGKVEVRAGDGRAAQRQFNQVDDFIPRQKIDDEMAKLPH
ncbi:MAG: hypothetical protein ACJ8M1_15170 [Chthoniobacterales bacterium]